MCVVRCEVILVPMQISTALCCVKGVRSSWHKTFYRVILTHFCLTFVREVCCEMEFCKIILVLFRPHTYTASFMIPCIVRWQNYFNVGVNMILKGSTSQQLSKYAVICSLWYTTFTKSWFWMKRFWHQNAFLLQWHVHNVRNQSFL